MKYVVKYFVYVLFWNDSKQYKTFTTLSEALNYISWIEELPNYRYHRLTEEASYG